MSKVFTPGEFAAFLFNIAKHLPEAEHRGLEAGAKLIQASAKSFIGTQAAAAGPFPAFAPLSGATLDGFVHPHGFNIPGKRELGFPDDPLLRTGEMRDSIDIKVEGRAAHIGSDDEKAEWQELGTPDALFPIPPRSFIGRAGFVQEAHAVKAVGDHIAKVLGGRGE